MDNLRITINLLTYNSAKYLEMLFNSLKNQTWSNWYLNILDNNSSDDTIVVIKKELTRLEHKYNLTSEKKNLGFAVGHNKLLERTHSNYFLILNDDTILEKDCLEKLVNFLEKNNNIASVSPRLMRLQNKEIVDSLGLKIMRNRRVVDNYAGLSWSEVYTNYSINKLSNHTLVFGISGTCAMLRKSIIKKVSYNNNELFDSSYFMYKEDVDLAYRLQQAGFTSSVLFDAVCYHNRSGAGRKDLSDIAMIKNKKNQSKIVKYYSYKNHLATLYKNEYWQNFILDWPSILWYEFKKFIYFLFFDRLVLRGWCDLYKNRKELKNKREQIKRMRKINWQKMRKRMFRDH